MHAHADRVAGNTVVDLYLVISELKSESPKFTLTIYYQSLY